MPIQSQIKSLFKGGKLEGDEVRKGTKKRNKGGER